jgi:hypothetical protein
MQLRQAGRMIHKKLKPILALALWTADQHQQPFLP